MHAISPIVARVRDLDVSHVHRGSQVQKAGYARPRGQSGEHHLFILLLPTNLTYRAGSLFFSYFSSVRSLALSRSDACSAPDQLLGHAVHVPQGVQLRALLPPERLLQLRLRARLPAYVPLPFPSLPISVLISIIISVLILSPPLSEFVCPHCPLPASPIPPHQLIKSPNIN